MKGLHLKVQSQISSNYLELSSRCIGETVIFIAAEYIEPRMKGAPHLKHLHLMDRMKGKASEDAAQWALFQLDDKWHYGQNDDQTFRWIVYHPPAIAGRERNIHQVGPAEPDCNYIYTYTMPASIHWQHCRDYCRDWNRASKSCCQHRNCRGNLWKRATKGFWHSWQVEECIRSKVWPPAS